MRSEMKKSSKASGLKSEDKCLGLWFNYQKKREWLYLGCLLISLSIPSDVAFVDIVENMWIGGLVWLLVCTIVQPNVQCTHVSMEELERHSKPHLNSKFRSE